MRLLLVLLLLAALAPAGAAEEPWLLDDEVRLARRFDPVDAMDRAASAEICRHNDCTTRLFIDGKATPELFLPWELITHLPDAYRTDNPRLRSLARTLRERDSRGLKIDQKFWDRLYKAGQPYFDAANSMEARRKRWAAAKEADRPKLLEEQSAAFDSLCMLAVEALEAARAEFGRATFDRFLYEAVAPGLVYFSSGETADSLRRDGRGCR